VLLSSTRDILHPLARTGGTNDMRLRMAMPAVAALLLAASVGHTEEKAAFKDMTVQEATALHKARTAVFLDANDDDFRKKHGSVPGAVRLTSSSRYDLAMLPSDKGKKLIFYCANSH
jgi:hypothetical protein